MLGYLLLHYRRYGSSDAGRYHGIVQYQSVMVAVVLGQRSNLSGCEIYMRILKAFFFGPDSFEDFLKFQWKMTSDIWSGM